MPGTDPTTVKPGDPNPNPAPSTEPNAEPNTPPADPPTADPPRTPAPAAPPKPFISPDAVGEALLNKIRKDEKDKHQGKINELEGDKTRLAQEKSDLEARLRKLEGNQEPDPPPADPTKAEIEKLRGQVAAAEAAANQTQQQMTALTEEATIRVRTGELNAHRERVLREKGITLTANLVTGASEAEIDAAAEAALAQQQQIQADAEAEVKKKMGLDVPEPLSPQAGPEGFASSLPLNTKERSNLVREKDPQKYNDRKAELLAAAKQRIGEK